MSDDLTVSRDEARALIREIAHNRARQVDLVVERRMKHRQHDVTEDQIQQWGQEQCDRWRADFPALSSFWRRAAQHFAANPPAVAGSQPSTAAGVPTTHDEPLRVEAVCRPDSPVNHDLKTWTPAFSAVAAGEKRFELRRNDRDYRVGDFLRLLEYDPDKGEYTGRGCVRRVVHLLPGGQFGLESGHVAMSLEVVDGEGRSLDWQRIATQIARYGGSYYGLTTPERDAVEAEVAGENERDFGIGDRTTDAANQGER